ncbi:MAG: hypothetical protein VXZ39_11525, partial [Planctomycetota bacterium]|nr:hypothetical protein [Planctomycetota bacterium]
DGMDAVAGAFLEHLGLAETPTGAAGSPPGRSRGGHRRGGDDPTHDEEADAFMLSALVLWGHGDAVFDGIERGLAAYADARLVVPGEGITHSVFMAGALFEVPSTRAAVLAGSPPGRVAPLLLRRKACANRAIDLLSSSSPESSGDGGATDAAAAAAAFVMTTLCKASLHATVAMRERGEAAGGAAAADGGPMGAVAIGRVLTELFARCDEMIRVDAGDAAAGGPAGCLLAVQTTLGFAGEAAALRCLPVDTTLAVLDSVVPTMGWLRTAGRAASADARAKITGHLGRFMYASANLEEARARVHEVALRVQDLADDEDCASSIRPWLSQYCSTYNASLAPRA